MKYFIKIFL